MTTELKPLIAANWKMHGDTGWADKVFEFDRLHTQSSRSDMDILICPPAVFLSAMYDRARQAGILLGAQDCHAQAEGAYTGSLSAEMLQSVGADYVILGHSEKRASGDTNSMVMAKAEAAKRAGLIPIICVGESEAQRGAGQALDVVKAQIENSVPTLADYIIAYEPVWAIGTGKVATLEDIAQVHDALREIVGDQTRLLYGGSVKPANAQGILGLKNVNGALIGGAGLEMESLSEIAHFASNQG